MSESDGSDRQQQVLITWNAEKERKLLEHYDEKSYLYGRRALKAHATALLYQYMKKEKENMMQAALQREMAREQGQHISARACCIRQRREGGQDSGGGG
jgi:hypothetical protein